MDLPSKKKDPLPLEKRKTLYYHINAENNSIDFTIKINYDRSPQSVKKEEMEFFRKKLFILLFNKFNLLDNLKKCIFYTSNIIKNAVVFTILLDKNINIERIKKMADLIFNYIGSNYKSLNEIRKCGKTLNILAYRKFLSYATDKQYIAAFESFKLNPNKTSFHCKNNAIGYSEYNSSESNTTGYSCANCHFIGKTEYSTKSSSSSSSSKLKRKCGGNKEEANESQQKKEKKRKI